MKPTLDSGVQAWINHVEYLEAKVKRLNCDHHNTIKINIEIASMLARLCEKIEAFFDPDTSGSLPEDIQQWFDRFKGRKQ